MDDLNFPTGPPALAVFACSCPWHSGPVPVGEQYRDGSGHYPGAWCVECCAELPYRLAPRELAKLAPADRPAVAVWLDDHGYPRLSRSLARGVGRQSLAVALSRDNRTAWQRRGWPAPTHLSWHRVCLPDVTACCELNRRYFEGFWNRVRLGVWRCPLCGLYHVAADRVTGRNCRTREMRNAS